MDNSKENNCKEPEETKEEPKEESKEELDVDVLEMLHMMGIVTLLFIILIVGTGYVMPKIATEITNTAQHVMGEQIDSSVSAEEVDRSKEEYKDLIGIKTGTEEEALDEKELTKVIGIKGYKIMKDKVYLKTTKGNTSVVKLSEETIKAYYIDDTRGISKEYKAKLKGVNYIPSTKDGSNAKLLFKDYATYKLYEADVEYAKIKSGL